MKINYPELTSLAKSVTELAIQGNFITKYEKAEDTAKEIATFYKALVDEIAKD